MRSTEVRRAARAGLDRGQAAPALRNGLLPPHPVQALTQPADDGRPAAGDGKCDRARACAHNGAMNCRPWAACLFLCGTAAAQAQGGFVPGRYEVTRETVLPHLEEALRYATTRRVECLPSPSGERLFLLLDHEAFAGCTLEPAAPAGAPGEGTWALRCANPQAASGHAWLQAGARRFTATLEVKMGGKNMTLSQRVQGVRVADCAPGERP